MSSPASLTWFARHELSLSWRDFITMMTAGKPHRQMAVIIFILIASVIMHVFAWAVIGPSLPFTESGANDQGVLIIVTGLIALSFSLMSSQAMESVTRVFYARSDLDLILSSPASTRRVFTVRIAAVAFSTTMLSLLLAAPAINVLAVLHSPYWLGAYLLIFGLGIIATIFSLSLTIILFRTVGAKRTRLISQIVAALVGAVFIIGVQLAAIASIGSVSRLDFLVSDTVRSWAPNNDSLLWIPARAAMGEPGPLMLVVISAVLLFGWAIAAFSSGFSEKVLAAAGLSQGISKTRDRGPSFRQRGAIPTLRLKEWKLLLRDHWLISQTLMQVFYLIPPAFMLWQGFGTTSALSTVIAPVLVMASGQLAGGLAWLAISGEDAPQLVATAPVSRTSIIRAKVEAVLSAVAVLVVPILLVMAWADMKVALVCACCILAAAASATAIQLWFRSQARRSNFRRRQTSSRVATFAEAFSSIFWAGSAALWANGSLYALVLISCALIVLAIARALRPNLTDEFLY
ncbi:MAG: permease [Pseudomonadota bacterium]